MVFSNRIEAIDNNSSHGNHVVNIGIGFTWGGAPRTPKPQLRAAMPFSDASFCRQFRAGEKNGMASAYDKESRMVTVLLKRPANNAADRKTIRQGWEDRVPYPLLQEISLC